LGCAFLVPAVLVVVIEGLVLKFACGRPPKCFLASFMANLASALAGLALMFLFTAGWRWMPIELDRYYTADRIFTLVRYTGYFLLSVGVEYLVVRWVLLARDGAKRLGRGVLLGNVMTYALLCPLLYFMTRPQQDLTDLRADSAWSADATTAILYLNPANGYLMRTDPKRAHTATVLARHMTDYQIRPDLHSGLYLDGEQLWWFKDAHVIPVAKLQASERRAYPMISQASLSPSGRYVAYTTPIKKKNDAAFEYEAGHQLMIFDAARTQSQPVKSSLEENADAPALVWTEQEMIVLVTTSWEKEIKQLKFAPDHDSVEERVWLRETSAAAVYGTFGTIYLSGLSSDFLVAADVTPDLSASVSYFLGITQKLRVWHGSAPVGPGPLEMALRGSVSGTPGRWDLADVAVIRGSSLCVLEEDAAPMLYLIDADARRLGRLVVGRKMVLLTEKYEAGKYLKKE
jgi:hypothetical protein